MDKIPMLEMVKNKVYVFIIRGDSMRVVLGEDCDGLVCVASNTFWDFESNDSGINYVWGEK